MEYFWEGRINTKKYNNKWKERKDRERERKGGKLRVNSVPKLMCQTRFMTSLHSTT